MTEPTVSDACEYAALLSDICKLSTDRSRREGELTNQVFRRLGWETTFNKRGWCMRKPGESHWQSQPRILSDFGTAVMHTIGHRYGSLDDPLEENWYIREMQETSEAAEALHGGRIAAWAVRLHKVNKPYADAIAMTPAAALVAAWLRAHP